MSIYIKKLILIFVFIMVRSAYAYALPPAIFYSDLTSGPNLGGRDNKGAFVTIWGKNFGASQGESYVSVGGGKVDNYPLWSDTKISFQLGRNTASGNIMVITKEGFSNVAPFVIRDGNIFFVKTTGNDKEGDGSWLVPWRTIVKAKNSLNPGDIAYIGDGVNQTALDSYNACVNLGSHGQEGQPKALVAYPGATVNVGSANINKAFGNWVTGGAGGYAGKYWVISQFNITAHFTATNLSLGYRIIGNKITIPNGDGSTAALELGGGDGSYSRILGNEFYNCGTPNASKLYHNIYINNHTGNEITDIEIGWNIIRDSTANRGIQIYSDGKGSAPISDMRIHNNLLYNLRGNGINLNSKLRGEAKVYNNIIFGCGKGPDFRDGMSNYAGILIGGENTANIYLYNNHIFACGYARHAESFALLYIAPNYIGTLNIRNNIFYSGGQSAYIISNGALPPRGKYHNLFFGKGAAPAWDTAAVNSQPQFQELKSYNVHLKAASPAIDAGTDDVSDIVNTDFDGVQRPQGKAYDIGAFESAM